MTGSGLRPGDKQQSNQLDRINPHHRRWGCLTHRLDTEPLAALPPLSLPFPAAVEEAVAAAGSVFCEAMCAIGPVIAAKTEEEIGGHGGTNTDTQLSHCGCTHVQVVQVFSIS